MLYSRSRAFAQTLGESAETARRKPGNKRRILEDRHFSRSHIQRASFVSGNAVYSSPQDLVFQQYVRLEKWFTAGWLSLGLVSLPVGLPTFAEFRSFSGRQASMRNSRGRTSIVRTYDYYAVSRCARVLLYADLCNVT